jgi:hypothetical protein
MLLIVTMEHQALGRWVFLDQLNFRMREVSP